MANTSLSPMEVITTEAYAKKWTAMHVTPLLAALVASGALVRLAPLVYQITKTGDIINCTGDSAKVSRG